MNTTIEKFGYPATLLTEWNHWLLLLRPAQPTLGSCILAAKSDAAAFGDLAAEAHAELATITKEIETKLNAAFDYAKINYLMLMMVDPDVHFHVIPRYEGAREHGGVSFPDAGWPGTPALASAVELSPQMLADLTSELRRDWSAV